MYISLGPIRLITLTSFVLLTLILAPSVWAQGQRIALLPIRTQLAIPLGHTKPLKSICLDKPLKAPKHSELYHHLLTPIQGMQVTVGEGPGQFTMPLDKAIEKDIIELRGLEKRPFEFLAPLNSHLQIKNIDPERRPISLHIAEPVIVHSEQGIYENKAVLKELKEFSNRQLSISDGAIEELQKAVWKKSKHLRGIVLNLLDAGYLKSSPEETRSVVISQALQQLQQANGLRITGDADEPTMTALAKNAAELYGPLLRAIAPLEINDQSLEVLTHRFQENLDLPPTGQFDPETVDSLRDTIDSRLQAIRVEGETPDARLREYQRRNGFPIHGRLTPQLVAQFESEIAGRNLIRKAALFNPEYVQHRYGIDLAKRSDHRRILAVQELSQGKAIGQLNDSNEKYILIGADSGDIELRIVRSQPGSVFSFEPIYRVDPKALKNGNAIEAMDKLSRKLAADKSDATTRFVHAGSYEPTSGEGRGAFRLQLGEQEITLSAADHEALFNQNLNVPIPMLDNYMNALPSNVDGGKPRFIIYRDAFAQGSFGHGGGRPPKPPKDSDAAGGEGNEGPQPYGYHESRRHVHPTVLLAVLKARYREKGDFLLDDEMDRGKANAASLPFVAKGNDIVAYLASNDPLRGTISNRISKTDGQVQQFKIIENIAEYLRETGVEIISDFTRSAKTNVLVVTGHKDRNFVDYVNDLGFNGVFKDHIVALASCYEVGDEALNARIIRDYQAKAVLFFDRRLNPHAVESVLYEMSRILKESNYSSSRFDDLLNRSVDRALKDPQNASWRNDIEKMRRSLIQVSRLTIDRATGVRAG